MGRRERRLRAGVLGDERGAAALLLVLALLIVGLAFFFRSLATARVLVLNLQSQAAADAAALAGVSAFRAPAYDLGGDALTAEAAADGPRTLAQDLAFRNAVGEDAGGMPWFPVLDPNASNDPSGDIVLLRVHGAKTAAAPYDSVYVKVVRQPAPIILKTSVTLGASAQAIGVPATTIGAGRQTVDAGAVVAASGAFPLAIDVDVATSTLGAGLPLLVDLAALTPLAEFTTFGDVPSAARVSAMIRFLCFTSGQTPDPVGDAPPLVSVGDTAAVIAVDPGPLGELAARSIGRTLVVAYVDSSKQVVGFGRAQPSLLVGTLLTLESVPSAVGRNALAIDAADLEPDLYRTSGDPSSGPLASGVALAPVLYR